MQKARDLDALLGGPAGPALEDAKLQLRTALTEVADDIEAALADAVPIPAIAGLLADADLTGPQGLQLKLRQRGTERRWHSSGAQRDPDGLRLRVGLGAARVGGQPAGGVDDERVEGVVGGGDEGLGPRRMRGSQKVSMCRAIASAASGAGRCANWRAMSLPIRASG